MQQVVSNEAAAGAGEFGQGCVNLGCEPSKTPVPPLYSIHRDKVCATVPVGGSEWERPDEVGQSVRERLVRFSRAKNDTLRFAEEFLTNDPSERKERKLLRECASWLWFREYLQTGKSYLVRGNFCNKHRICQPCAIRASGRDVANLVPAVLGLLRKNPTWTAVMWTATLRDGPLLGQTLDRLSVGLQRQWSYVRHARRGARGYDESFACCQGLAGHIEIKRGKNSGLWHPHFHGVLLFDGWLDFARWNQQWATSIEQEFVPGDSIRQFDANVWRHRDPERFAQVLPHDLAEICKYSVKFQDMPDVDRWHCYEYMRAVRTRLGRSYGCLRGQMRLDASEADQCEDLGPWVECMYRFIERDYALTVQRRGVEEGVEAPF